jgi:hypothetical protein
MQLRHAPRYKRRLPVRFWHPETGDAHQAFTIDISLVGMFIGIRAPLPRARGCASRSSSRGTTTSSRAK